MYNVAIIGAGPAGIFTALEIVKLKPEWKVVLIEKGARIEKRVCLLREGYKSCPSCKTCGLLCGWGGAGAFSDGKLTLTPDVGGHLVDYMSFKDVENLIQYCDDIYLEHGATEVVYGRNRNEFADIERAATLAELKLVHSPVRHLGTEKSLHVLKHMQDYLEDKIEIINNKTVDKLDIENNKIKGFTLSDGTKIDSEYVVVAPGREGADWFSKELIKNGVELINNAVDVGVRVELPAAVMEPITSRLYESKLIYYSPTFGDEVRTFCMNPNGEVVSENYNGIQTVNGHSYADKKTQNTNFALLVSKKFTEPFKEPITYGQHVASLANMLSGGGILVQRFGDLLDGKRSTPDRIKESIIKPTLECAMPGDLSLVLPHRILTDIIETVYALDSVAPGTANDDTLLYGCESKYYSVKPQMDDNFSIMPNVYVVGDGSGVCRGLSQSAAMGLYVAEKICKN